MRLAALGLGLSAIACLSARSAESREPRAPSRAAISIAGFKFAPVEVTVSAGDSVVWRNDDQFAHTTTADSGAWSSPELKSGERYTFVPRRSGRYSYHCAAHPVMRAVVIVRD